ncbi:hypothetical protein ACE3MQ_06250 [Paenibacillus lentus]|uniref:hypothetical protein n=1 Tax=Paenibacillus lentus TaxID=1338368 RepID=UPI00366938A9
MRRKNLRIIIIVLFIILLLFYIGNQNGYSIGENQALRKSFPFVAGEVAYQSKYGNKKIVIWKTENMSYVKLLNTKLGVLHHVSNISELHAREPNDALKRTWSAQLKSNKKYATTFAVEALDPKIKEVIVSNDNIDGIFLNDINEIERVSTVFVEIPVENGFAAAYLELNSSDVGDFVFRGLDKDGNIITAGR